MSELEKSDDGSLCLEEPTLGPFAQIKQSDPEISNADHNLRIEQWLKDVIGVGSHENDLPNDDIETNHDCASTSRANNATGTDYNNSLDSISFRAAGSQDGVYKSDSESEHEDLTETMVSSAIDGQN